MRNARNAFLLFLFTPLFLAADTRNQSHVTFDDGSSVVRQALDQREIAVRKNMPIYPGDELRSERRGRTEVRLSDGNVVAIDRNSAIRFESIFDSVEGDAEETDETVIELRFGHVIVHRLSRNAASMRLDTRSASYVGSSGSIYAVESADSDFDSLSVYKGTVEVRTPAGTTRVRQGEQTRIDESGAFASNDVLSGGTSDFERWYIRRADRYGRSSRYLDRSLAYADDELNDYGSWLYVSDWGWTWRPRVAGGWKPYYYGGWQYAPSGRLIWVSDEPWGWIPYHYGRWAYSPVYGWVWVPGSGYSHAWVYWAYGRNHFGWVPAGYYDCYRPWYRNLYEPYARASFSAGFGFHGRVKIHDIDLAGWTFLNSGQIISTRVDRAALTADAVRARLTRDSGAITVSNIQARFGRGDLENPNTVIEAVARRGLGGGTGKEDSGSQPDVTAFLRRDPELSTNAIDRLIRPSRGSETAGRGGAAGAGPSRDGGRITIDRSRSGSPAPPATSDAGRARTGIDRGTGATPPSSGGIERRQPDAPVEGTPRVPRSRIGDEPSASPIPRSRAIASPADSTAPESESGIRRAPRESAPQPSDWRSSGRASRERAATEPSGAPPRPSVERPDPEASKGTEQSWRGRTSRPSDDTPRRVIDQIGGARVTPRRDTPESSARPRVDRSRESSRSESSPRGDRPRSSDSPRVERSPSVDRAPSAERSAPAPDAAPAPQASPRNDSDGSGTRSNMNPD